MILPNQIQEKWLKDNYKLYSHLQLAEHLKITQLLLSKWLKHLGLKKCKNGRSASISRKQAAFIKDNYQSMAHEEIAISLQMSVSTVHAFCCRNGLKKYRKLPEKKIIAIATKKKEARPPAVYGNISREQHIERWINFK